MIDQRVKEHVIRQVDAVEGARGDYENVVRRGERRQRTTRGLQAVAAILLAVGLVGVATQLADRPVADGIAEPDVELTVNPGERSGALAEELAERSGPRAVEETASHIGWVETPQGRFDLVTYVVDDDPNRPADRPTCAEGVFVGVVSDDPRFGFGRCDPSGEIPPLSGGYGLEDDFGREDGFFYILERTPANTEHVIVATSEEKSVRIATRGGYVFVAWPTSWGPPTLLTAHDVDGSQTGSMSYTE